MKLILLSSFVLLLSLSLVMPGSCSLAQEKPDHSAKQQAKSLGISTPVLKSIGGILPPSLIDQAAAGCHRYWVLKRPFEHFENWYSCRAGSFRPFLAWPVGTGHTKFANTNFESALDDSSTPKVEKGVPAIPANAKHDKKDPPKNYTGKWTYTWPDTKKTSGEVYFLDGVRHGTATAWHSNGQKSSESKYVNGIQLGPYSTWHENGQKKEEGSLKLSSLNVGCLHGKITRWDKSGRVIAQNMYRDGMPLGFDVPKLLGGRYYQPAIRGKLEIEMDQVQTSGAPVICTVALTTTSKEPIQGHFDQNTWYQGVIIDQKGNESFVGLTNGSRIQGSFGALDSLGKGEVARTPLRVTSRAGLTNRMLHPGRDFLPSEQVYFSPGEYELVIIWIGHQSIEAITRKKFDVIEDADLSKARWKALSNPPSGLEPFYKHVIDATLTPELRAAWYQDIYESEPAEAVAKVYRLSIIEAPPEDVRLAMLKALQVHLDNQDYGNRKLNTILNNSAYSVAQWRVPLAGPTFAKLAVSKHGPNERAAAIRALPHYMGKRAVPVLTECLSDENPKIQKWAKQALETLEK